MGELKRLIYLAAPWADREIAKQWRDFLVDNGHQVVSRWLDEQVPEHGITTYYGDTDYRGSEMEAVMRDGALRDIADLNAADTFVILNCLGKSEGKTVETGYAVARKLPIIVVGKPTNIFHYLPGVKFVGDDPETKSLMALDLLEALASLP